jgi:hypothetical protein
MRTAQAHQSDAVTGSPESLMPSCAALRKYRPWPGILRHRDPRRQPKFAIKLPGFRRIDMLQEMVRYESSAGAGTGLPQCP